MEKTKENTIIKTPALRAAAFLLPLLLVLVLLTLLFEPKNNTTCDGMEKDMEMAIGILAEPENSIDALIIGDSETYSAFSPMQMWEEQGITSYVCGSPGQTLIESANILKQSLRTQTPKAVILETDVIFQQTEPQDLVFNAAANCLGVFRYHDRWKKLYPEDFYTAPHYTNVSNTKGFFIRHRSVAVDEEQQEQYMLYEKGERHLRSITLWSLNKILRICQKRNIPLILVSSPSTKNWDYKKHNRIQSYADQHGLSYLDLNLHNDELKINWSKDSIDGGDHLNLRGARKVTAFLGQWLKDTVELPDRRTDPDCQVWAELLERYHRAVSKGKGNHSLTEPTKIIVSQLVSGMNA